MPLAISSLASLARRSHTWRAAIESIDSQERAVKKLQVQGVHHITDEHLADAIELLLATRPRLTVDEKVSTPA